MRLFQSLVSSGNSDDWRNHHHAVRIRVRRDHFIEDTYASLAGATPQQLRGRIQVEFISEQGVVEPGIDGGGLFKSFVDDFISQAFDPLYGLFQVTSEHLLLPNPASYLVGEEHLQYFHFFGKMLGVAMHNVRFDLNKNIL